MSFLQNSSVSETRMYALAILHDFLVNQFSFPVVFRPKS